MDPDNCQFYLQDLHAAMKMLGLNPMEQEIIDLTNNIVRNGYIYFPEFCAVILKKFREDDEDVFNQNMFKVSSQAQNCNAMATCSFKAIKAQSNTQTRVYKHSFAFFMYLVLTFVLHLSSYLNDLKVIILLSI